MPTCMNEIFQRSTEILERVDEHVFVPIFFFLFFERMFVPIFSISFLLISLVLDVLLIFIKIIKYIIVVYTIKY